MSFFKVLLATILGFFLSLALLFAFFVAIVIALISSAGGEGEVLVADKSILEIDLSKGVMESRGSTSIPQLLQGGTGGISLRGLLDALERASDDDRVVAVRLMPAGYASGWAAAEEIRSALLDLRESGKFIIATSDANGFDEAAYFLATAADSIVLKPSARLELNGIGGTLMFFKPVLDKLGIRAETVRAGKFKNAIEPFILDSASAETTEMMRGIVDGTFSTFVSTVAQTRGIPVARLETLLNQRGLVAPSEAVREKLVDAVLYEDEILTRLKSRAGRKPDERLRRVSISDYINEEPADESGDEIAIVYAVGTITTGESTDEINPMGDGSAIGDVSFREAMTEARESESVKAVVLRIDSPGGAATASEEMWREIRLTAAKKPVIASMGAIAASGGYYIAVAADSIVADASTLTGSIGVFGLWFDASQFMRETIGINTQVVVSDSLADMLSPFRTPTTLERAIMQESVDSTYQRFLTVVSQGRGIPVARVHELGQGRVYTGAEAKRLGLIDEIGGLSRALQMAAGRARLDSGYTLRVLPRPKSVFESIADALDMQARILTGAQRPDRAVLAELRRRQGVQARSVTVAIR